MKFIEKYKSPNFNNRKKLAIIKYIILHYTAMDNYLEAIEHLCNKSNKVSSHFLINKNGKIFYLVDLKFRAWHAGKSSWQGTCDINSESIGIELDNSGHFNNFEKFNEKQINVLGKLLGFLIKKFKIPKTNILGHSDIAPYRKFDPGQKFPWIKLKKKQYVYFPKKLSEINYNKIDEHLDQKNLISVKNKSLFILKIIGYDVSLAKKNVKNFQMLIKAYQMHYRKSLVSGIIDTETFNILKSHFKEVLTK